jgi:hypothetical protein
MKDDYDSMLKSGALFQALLSEWPDSVMSGLSLLISGIKKMINCVIPDSGTARSWI